MEFNDLLDRFLRYVAVDTQSCHDSTTFPSTEKQLDLSCMLKQELLDLGLNDAEVTSWGYVCATLPTNKTGNVPTIALLAHVDTSEDVSGANVKARVHRQYNGKDIVLDTGAVAILRTKENPDLKSNKGKTIITTDGTTLLGGDDKAGIAEILAAIGYLIAHPDIPRPTIRVIFTPDEEVGRGVDHITAREIGADYGYTIDGEGVGTVNEETFCAASMDVVVHGVNVHPGYAKGKLINAVKIVADIIGRLPRRELSPETTGLRQGYIHPLTVCGNAEEAKIRFILRDFEDAGLVEKENYVRRIIEAVGKRYPKASIGTTVEHSYRNMKSILDQHPLVIAKAEAAVAKAGLVPELALVRGGTDGARLSFMGLPCPNIFTGTHNAHSKYEWVCLEEMEKAAETIVWLMQLWAE